MRRVFPIVAGLGALVLLAAACAPTGPLPPTGPSSVFAPPPTMAPATEPAPSPPPPALASRECDAPGWGRAAAQNAASLATLAWAPFGRPETGWEVYVPLIQHEIGTSCAATTGVFAQRLSAWAKPRRLSDDGVLTEPLFQEMKGAVQYRRDFVRFTSGGACPERYDDVVQTLPEEGTGGKPILIRRRTLEAYRRMVAAAKAEDPRIGDDPDNLTIFSGYRSPFADAQRCQVEGNCNGVARARCSAHRTGLALDLYVGHAQGYSADSTADPSRRYLVQTPAYRWLVANAGRFGFVNYPFEPWHWEWTGEAP